jgi:suppressor for copper-sensitivity B
MTKNFRFFAITLAFATIMTHSATARAAESDWVKADHVRARLLAVPEGVVPASSGNPAHAYGAIDIDMDSGWHAYWRMPGEGGLAPVINTEASENLKGINLIWPRPRRYETFGMYSFGYDDAFMLPFEILPQKDGAQVKLDVALDIMICNDICVPQSLHLALPVPSVKDKTAADDKDGQLIVQGISRAPIEKDMERMKIDTLVLGPDALVATVFSQNGFKDSDLFVELIGAKQDIYLTAPPEITVDGKDKRKAIMKIRAPEGAGNLAKLLEGGKVVLTFVAGKDAVTKTFPF